MNKVERARERARNVLSESGSDTELRCERALATLAPSTGQIKKLYLKTNREGSDFQSTWQTQQTSHRKTKCVQILKLSAKF